MLQPELVVVVRVLDILVCFIKYWGQKNLVVKSVDREVYCIKVSKSF